MSGLSDGSEEALWCFLLFSFADLWRRIRRDLVLSASKDDDDGKGNFSIRFFAVVEFKPCSDLDSLV